MTATTHATQTTAYVSERAINDALRAAWYRYPHARLIDLERHVQLAQLRPRARDDHLSDTPVRIALERFAFLPLVA